ncbi:MAG: hypothetical protein ACLFPW_00460 [Spirochaetaceae bacterium]
MIGLIPMFTYISFNVPKLRSILLPRIVVVLLGMIASFASFASFGRLSPIELGGFWLVLMGVGFLVDALWWTPSTLSPAGFSRSVRESWRFLL